MNIRFLATMVFILLASAGVCAVGVPYAKSHGYPSCRTAVINQTAAVCPTFIDVSQKVGLGVFMSGFLWVPAGLILPPDRKPGTRYIKARANQDERCPDGFFRRNCPKCNLDKDGA